MPGDYSKRRYNTQRDSDDRKYYEQRSYDHPRRSNIDDDRHYDSKSGERKDRSYKKERSRSPRRETSTRTTSRSHREYQKPIDYIKLENKDSKINSPRILQATKRTRNDRSVEKHREKLTSDPPIRIQENVEKEISEMSRPISADNQTYITRRALRQTYGLDDRESTLDSTSKHHKSKKGSHRSAQQEHRLNDVENWRLHTKGLLKVDWDELFSKSAPQPVGTAYTFSNRLSELNTFFSNKKPSLITEESTDEPNQIPKDYEILMKAIKMFSTNLQC